LLANWQDKIQARYKNYGQYWLAPLEAKRCPALEPNEFLDFSASKAHYFDTT
jgi:hypothetical protein